MDVESFRNTGIDVTQEGEELLMTVPWLTACENLTGGDIEGGEQRGRAMTEVVVGDAFNIAESHGEDRLSALKSLNLGLLIDREHDGMVGRIEV